MGNRLHGLPMGAGDSEVRNRRRALDVSAADRFYCFALSTAIMWA